MTRVLIVEDEPSIAMALEDDLRREGYEVQVARSMERKLAAPERRDGST
jgi:DNA-binding response OmpR family regulator